MTWENLNYCNNFLQKWLKISLIYVNLRVAQWWLTARRSWV